MDSLKLPRDVRALLGEQTTSQATSAQPAQGQQPQAQQPAQAPQQAQQPAQAPQQAASTGTGWTKAAIAKTYMGHGEKWAAQAARYASQILKDGQQVNRQDFTKEIAGIYGSTGDLSTAWKKVKQAGEWTADKAIRAGKWTADKVSQAAPTDQQNAPTDQQNAPTDQQNAPARGAERTGQFRQKSAAVRQLKKQAANAMAALETPLDVQANPEAGEIHKQLYALVQKAQNMDARNADPQEVKNLQTKISDYLKTYQFAVAEAIREMREALSPRLFESVARDLIERYRRLEELRMSSQLDTAVSRDGQWLRVQTPDGTVYQLKTDFEGGWPGTGLMSKLKARAGAAARLAGKAVGAVGKAALGATGRAIGAAGSAAVGTAGRAAGGAARGVADRVFGGGAGQARGPRGTQPAGNAPRGGVQTYAHPRANFGAGQLDRVMKNPQQFFQQLPQMAHSYAKVGRMGPGVRWSRGMSRIANRLQNNAVSIAKLKPAGKFQVYQVQNRAGQKYNFYVESQSVVRTDPFLDSLFEQDYNVMDDPKREAPDAAFDIGPPTPPEGSVYPVEEPQDFGGPQAEEAGAGGPGIDTPEKSANVAEKKPKYPDRVIAAQNGWWYVMPWENWVQFVIQGASGANWNLSNWGAGRPEMPNDVRQLATTGERPEYYSTDPNTNVYYVQGWQPKRFQAEKDYIRAADVSNLSLIEPKPGEDSGIPSFR